MTKPEQDHRKRGASPTIVAEFSDGEVARMTVWSRAGTPDVERGLKLAQHAYLSRMKQSPPAIVAAQFVRDGDVILELSAEQLRQAV